MKENDLEKIKKELNGVINAMPEEKRKEFKDKLKEISNANNFTFEDCFVINIEQQFAK